MGEALRCLQGADDRTLERIEFFQISPRLLPVADPRLDTV